MEALVIMQPDFMCLFMLLIGTELGLYHWRVVCDVKFLTPTEFLVILTTSGFFLWCTKGRSNLYYSPCALLLLIWPIIW